MHARTYSNTNRFQLYKTRQHRLTQNTRTRKLKHSILKIESSQCIPNHLNKYIFVQTLTSHTATSVYINPNENRIIDLNRIQPLFCESTMRWKRIQYYKTVFVSSYRSGFSYTEFVLFFLLFFYSLKRDLTTLILSSCM